MSLSGSVTLANTRLSLANGYAFFDTSAANADYANNINSQIEVTSVTTGKKAIGYIKAVGTGETLDSELVTNGDFASWTGGNPNSWNVAGGPEDANNYISEASGKAQLVSNKTIGELGVEQTITRVVGTLYKRTLSVVTVTSGGIVVYNDTNDGSTVGIYTTTGSKTLYAAYTPGHNGKVGVFNYNNTTNTIFDDFSVKQVLTPSATGVTITSTPGGSTYNWASIESGFNYNDALGYTWKIIPHTRFSRGRRRYIDVYGIERTVFYK